MRPAPPHLPPPSHNPRLLQILKQRYDELRLFKCPQKRWFSSFATQTVEQRRRVFEVYLLELVRVSPSLLRLCLHWRCTISLRASRPTPAPSPPASFTAALAAAAAGRAERLPGH